MFPLPLHQHKYAYAPVETSTMKVMDRPEDVTAVGFHLSLLHAQIVSHLALKFGRRQAHRTMTI
jgi:hypothetical protein